MHPRPRLPLSLWQWLQRQRRFPVAGWIATPAHCTGQWPPWLHLTVLSVVVLEITIGKKQQRLSFPSVRRALVSFPFGMQNGTSLQREDDAVKAIRSTTSLHIANETNKTIQNQKNIYITEHKLNVKKIYVSPQHNKSV